MIRVGVLRHGEATFEQNSGWRKHETDLRTTTIGDSVFKKSSRPFHNISEDAMKEVKLRTWSRNYIGQERPQNRFHGRIEMCVTKEKSILWGRCGTAGTDVSEA